MALVQYEIASQSNPEGQICRFILEYEDSTMRATGLRCINDSDDRAYGEVIRLQNRQKYSAVFLPRTDTMISIPQTNPNSRISVQVHSSGDVIGFDGHFLFPYFG